jgi:hypothetical protein
VNIKSLVDRGLEIRTQLETLRTELKAIETKLQKAGLAADHEELKDPDREGRRWLATGTEKRVPVIFTADKLVGTFQESSPTHLKILPVSSGHFEDFFKPIRAFENRYDDGKKFRTRADELLGKDAPRFITACLAVDKHGIPKSDIKVEWDQAEPIPAP